MPLQTPVAFPRRQEHQWQDMTGVTGSLVPARRAPIPNPVIPPRIRPFRPVDAAALLPGHPGPAAPSDPGSPARGAAAGAGSPARRHRHRAVRSRRASPGAAGTGIAPPRQLGPTQEIPLWWPRPQALGSSLPSEAAEDRSPGWLPAWLPCSRPCPCPGRPGPLRSLQESRSRPGAERWALLTGAQRLDELLLVHGRPALDADLLGPGPQL